MLRAKRITRGHTEVDGEHLRRAAGDCLESALSAAVNVSVLLSPAFSDSLETKLRGASFGGPYSALQFESVASGDTGDICACAVTGA
jgi:hypothetical protein